LSNELLNIWDAADAEISMVVAISLSTLTFAAATFLTGWVKTKDEAVASVAREDHLDQQKLTHARTQLSCAKQSVKDLLMAFAAFTFLLAQSVFIDPVSVATTQWNTSALLDAITASGGLGAGVICLLKAAWNVHNSVA